MWSVFSKNQLLLMDCLDLTQQLPGWGKNFTPDLVLFVTFLAGQRILGTFRKLKKKGMYLYKPSDCIRESVDNTPLLTQVKTP